MILLQFLQIGFEEKLPEAYLGLRDFDLGLPLRKWPVGRNAGRPVHIFNFNVIHGPSNRLLTHRCGVGELSPMGASNICSMSKS